MSAEIKDLSGATPSLSEAERAALLEFTAQDIHDYEEGQLTKKEKLKFLLLSPLVNSIIKFVLIGLGLVGGILWLLAALIPGFADSLSGLYIGFVSFLAAINNILPFSVFELLFILIPVGIIAYLVFAIVKTVQIKNGGKLLIARTWIQVGYSMIALLLIIALLFSLSFGIATGREDFEKASEVNKQPLYTEAKVTEAELAETTLYLIDKLNTVVINDGGQTIFFDSAKGSSKYAKEGDDTASLSKAVSDAFDNAAKDIKVLEGPEIVAKDMMAGPLFNSLTVGSMYAPITGEVLVNPYYPDVAVPMLIARGMAKERGFQDDEQASVIAYLVCTRYSDDPYVQYSAYFDAYVNTGSKMAKRNPNTYVNVASALKESVKKEVVAYTNTLDKLYAGTSGKLAFAETSTPTSNDNYKLYPKLMVTYYRTHLQQNANPDPFSCQYYVNVLVDLYRQDQQFQLDVNALKDQYSTPNENTTHQILDENGNVISEGSGSAPTEDQLVENTSADTENKEETETPAA